MGLRTRRRLTVEIAPEIVWTGRLQFDVLAGVTGGFLGVCEMALRREDLEISYRGHNMAWIDRDTFRAWLRRPAGNFIVDDITFTVVGCRLCIALGVATPLALPADVAYQLTQVI